MNKEVELFGSRLFIQVHEVKKKKQDPDFSLHLVYNAQDYNYNMGQLEHA